MSRLQSLISSYHCGILIMKTMNDLCADTLYNMTCFCYLKCPVCIMYSKNKPSEPLI